MRGLVVLGTLLIGAAHVPSITESASTFVPGVTWQPVPFYGRLHLSGRTEQAILGVTPTEIVIAVFLNGAGEKPEVFATLGRARRSSSQAYP